jgi:hypothetical protein
MTPIIKGVQADELGRVWPRVKPLVDSALRYCLRDHAAEDVLASLKESKRQLFVTWPDCRSMGITQLDPPVLTIFAYAGQLFPEWRSVLEGVKAWGREQGCTRLRIEGRRGWLRLVSEAERIEA